MARFGDTIQFWCLFFWRQSALVISKYLPTRQVVEKCMRLAEKLKQLELENISQFVLVNDPEHESRMLFHCAMYFRGLISSIQKQATMGDIGGFI